jgi:hypothetical protein
MFIHTFQNNSIKTRITLGIEKIPNVILQFCSALLFLEEFFNSVQTSVLAVPIVLLLSSRWVRRDREGGVE